MIGQTISHYRIVEKIGAGGMGVVYRAHDDRLCRDVALKVLPAAKLGDETARRALLQEALTVSAMSHPNICTVYDAGDSAGDIYFAMEYIEGVPLSAEIPSDGLFVPTAIRYAEQIADALEHAHTHGVVHRDLKSANVMVTAQGRTKVLDFGLALRDRSNALDAVTHSSDSVTELGGLAGTLPYMAPELLRGAAQADERSDIWSLGVMLYEMVSGVRPFRGRTGFELSSAILREPPPPLPAGVPTGLAGIVYRSLEKEPGRRYQRAGEVRAALEAVSSVALVTARNGFALSRRKWWWTAGALAVLALALLLWRVTFLRQQPFGFTRRIQSLAVLPLSDLSTDHAQEMFADGMTEALITDLSKVHALRVISRTSVMQYKGTQKPVHEIGRELNVDAAVSGTVMRSDNRVRISVELADARTDRNLWAESYEGDIRSVMDLQSRVARAIADEVQVQLTPEEHARLANNRSVDPQAYDAYLRGEYFWNKRTPDDLNRSIDYFRKAIDIDPTYALAYAGLAQAHILMAVYGEVAPRDAMPKAKTAAKRALEIDHGIAEAEAALADVEWSYDWDAAAAETAFQEALAINPSYATGHQWYALYLSNLGKNEEAISQMRRAQELDPLSLIIQVNVGWCYYVARHYDQAIALLRPVEEREPNFWLVHSTVGETYLATGQVADAIRELELATTLSSESTRNSALLGDAYALAGRRADARRLIEELISLSSKRYISPVYIAIIYIGLGQREQAVAWLEKAHADRSDWMVLLRTEPVFDQVRSESHFQELLHEVGIPP